MAIYLSKILFLLLFSAFVIYNYYFNFPSHIVSSSWYFFYLFVVIISYSLYKIFQFNNSKDKAFFSNLSIVWYFLLILFFICINFFMISSWNFNVFWWWIILFFKILFFSILPISIIVITTSFGKFLIEKIPWIEKYDYWFQTIISIVIGFISFISILTIFWIFNLYNLYIVFLILWVFLYFWYKNLLKLYKDFLEKKYEYSITEWSYLYLLSKEFFFIVAFTILSIWLVSIFRPFPIWWDDLWVYMNYPNLMAESGSLLSLWAMYSWQVFTWIWYMFWNATQAFYLSITWWFLSFFILNYILSDLVKSYYSDKKYILDMSTILSTIFISLPMMVFITTKDVKVDAGLFFISIVGLYILIKFYLLEIYDKKSSQLDITQNTNLYLFLIVWIIAWFAFSIKFTALILIVWIISFLSYVRIWVFWFLWFLFIFFSIFTGLDLWKMMNVLINPYNIDWFEKTFSLISALLWIILFSVWLFLNKKNVVYFIKEFFVFIFWVVLILTPWFWKNISESLPNITVWTLLWWTTDSFRADFTKIYTDDELSDLRKNASWSQNRWNAITTNEDLLRYFWYEKWIVDFVYMPWNLTMQKNQWGEYTDISFLFLALLPLIFIFLPYRKKYFALFFVFISLFQLLSYLQVENKKIDKQYFSEVSNESLSWVFTTYDFIFKKDYKWPSVYDINFSNYIDDELIINSIPSEEIIEKTRLFLSQKIDEEAKKTLKLSIDNTEENFNEIYTSLSISYLGDFDVYKNMILQQELSVLKWQIKNNFYWEIIEKVENINLWRDLSFLSTPITEKDFEFIKELNFLYDNYFLFDISNIVSLNEVLDSNNASVEEKEIINRLWKENRTINWKIIDYFSKVNLPLWYLYLFLWFFVPTLFLIFTLKHTKLTYIFIANIVFASTYTFLWLISSFGIVWYWVTMYFSFLLMIAISSYYIISYKEDDLEKVFLWKLLWSFVLLTIFLIYVFNSIIPNNFNNLKEAWFLDYKLSQLSEKSAIFSYNNDYTEILFNLNIDKEKRKEFLEKYISPEIVLKIPSILESDIITIITILNILSENEENELYNVAKYSKEKLYKNISYPDDYFKNKEKIYRVWTFLRYYVSENNNRLLEDSLLFTFNDYIYSENLDLTIDRFQKLWIDYLLIDLNAATIDQSTTKALTNRYENMLKTFTSDRLELISTDSICLRVWFERYKSTRDINEFMLLAWINYESYDDDWNIVLRSTKRNECAKYISFLLENDLVNTKSYTFLMDYKNHFLSRTINVSEINNLIWTTYKALFKIK